MFLKWTRIQHLDVDHTSGREKETCKLTQMQKFGFVILHHNVIIHSIDSYTHFNESNPVFCVETQMCVCVLPLEKTEICMYFIKGHCIHGGEIVTHQIIYTSELLILDSFYDSCWKKISKIVYTYTFPHFLNFK